MLKLVSKFLDHLRLDLRSLALARIFIGIILFLNLIITSTEINSFFTDQSALPSTAFIEINKELPYSINFLSGNYWFQILIFGIGIISSIALTLGAYTKLSSFFSWFIFLNIYNRANIIFDGGDVAIKLFLFCFCFLPISKKLSLDSINKEDTDTKAPLAASLLFTVQLASIYFFSALLKSSPRWFPEGNALYYALALDTFTSNLGKLLLHFPTILTISTLAVWFAEIILPIAIFIPILTKQIRYFSIITFILFHIGIILFMNIGLFPWTMISAWLAIIPSSLWESDWGKQVYTVVTGLFTKLSTKIKFIIINSDPIFGLGKFNAILSFSFLLYITLWNIRTIDFNRYEKYFSAKLNPIGTTIGIDQYWPLFAPFPMTEGGWYMFIGNTSNQGDIDLLTNEAPNFERPFSSSDTYKNFRWKKYLINLWHKNYSNYRKYLAQYLCKNWNSKHEDKISHIEIYYMLENVLPPEFKQNKAPANKTLTWSQECK